MKATDKEVSETVRFVEKKFDRDDPKDIYNRSVPLRVLRFFQGAEAMRRIAAGFDEVLSHLLHAVQVRPGGECLPTDEIRAAVRGIQETIGKNLPATACPCGDDEVCTRCGGKKWLTTRDLQEISDHLKRLESEGASGDREDSPRSTAKDSAG